MIAIILNRIHFTASFSHPPSFRISNAQRFSLRLFWIIFFEQFYLIDFNAPWANARIDDFLGVHIQLNFIRFAYVYLHLITMKFVYEKHSMKFFYEIFPWKIFYKKFDVSKNNFQIFPKFAKTLPSTARTRVLKSILMQFQTFSMEYSFYLIDIQNYSRRIKSFTWYLLGVDSIKLKPPNHMSDCTGYNYQP